MYQPTKRFHLLQPFLSTCEAEVTDIHPEKGIATSATVAFAEGGGQEGDHGFIYTAEEEAVPFMDTQKGPGRLLLLDGFPSIQVDTPVYHKVSPENLKKFSLGMSVKIAIDIERRVRLTVSHSGIHAVLYGLIQIKSGIYKSIRGCSIRPEVARLDFALENDEKFTDGEISRARIFTDRMIAENWEASTYAHPSEPEAMFWKCGEAVWPCGGTHLPTLADVGFVDTAKKSLGAKMQRVTLTFPNAVFRTDSFQA